MDVDRIVAELKMERGRLDQAIAALEGGIGRGTPIGKSLAAGATKSSSKKSKGITAAGRRRLSEAMKARWASRKSKPASGLRNTSAAGKRGPKRGMSAAAKKLISEAMKKRWADKRKASSRKAVSGSTSTE
jgi:hypothetical protein